MYNNMYKSGAESYALTDLSWFQFSAKIKYRKRPNKHPGRLFNFRGPSGGA